MLRLIGKTLLQFAAMLFIVTALVFILMALVPGDAARAILATSGGGSEEQYLQLRERLGLDLPLWQQYANYWGGVFSGSFGTTLATEQPVMNQILSRLPITLSLVTLASIVATILGILLGVAAATARRRPVRASLDTLSLLGTALPSYWLAIVGIMVFSIAIPLFPATGYVDFFDSPAEWARSLVLPVAALSVGGVALIAKTTRDGMLRNISGISARMLRGNGVGEGSIIWRHALKDSMLPVLPVINIMFVAALGGAVFVETVFSLNGLGSYIVNAVTMHEINQILAVAIVFTVFVGVANIIVDLLAGVFDPRLRRGQA